MAVPVVESVATTVTDATSTSFTVAKPAGTVSGNLLVAFMTIASSPTITPPSGWTAIGSAVATQFAGGKVAGFWRIAGGSEPSSYTWSLSFAAYSSGGIYRISGADATTPIDVFASATGAGSTSQTSPSVTTTGADRLILRTAGSERLGSTSWASSAEDWDLQGTAAFDATSNTAAHASKTSAGATGTEAFTFAAGRGCGLITVAIAPAAGSGSQLGSIFNGGIFGGNQSWPY